MNDPQRLGKLEPLENAVEFIPSSGGCVVSLSILDGEQLRWAFREASINPQDNGWRFMAGTDTQEYTSDSANQRIRTFNTVANIEPAVLEIYGAPVGIDLQLVIQDGRRTWYDNATGRPLVIPGR